MLLTTVTPINLILKSNKKKTVPRPHTHTVERLSFSQLHAASLKEEINATEFYLRSEQGVGVAHGSGETQLHSFLMGCQSISSFPDPSHLHFLINKPGIIIPVSKGCCENSKGTRNKCQFRPFNLMSWLKKKIYTEPPQCDSNNFLFLSISNHTPM